MMKFIFPDFNKNILNVSATLLEYLGIESEYGKITFLENELKKKYQNVILLVVDGLGVKVLNDNLDSNAFLRKNQLETITSVFPSTTTNATMTLRTATPPSEHGWLGWALNFQDEKKIVEIFLNQEYYTKEVLSKGFSEKRLPFRPFYLKNGIRADIQIYTALPPYITDNQIDNNYVHYETKELFDNLNKICQKEGNKFIYAYLDEPDKGMHLYGTKSLYARQKLEQINQLTEEFISKNPNTLLIITADHGHIDIEGYIEIYKDQAILACMAEKFSLEPRACAFHLKPGFEQQFLTAFKKYQQDFELFKTSDLIERGVFGDEIKVKQRSFLGDYIAVGKETNKILLFKPDANRFVGHHTGLTKAEMDLPLIVVKKGG